MNVSALERILLITVVVSVVYRHLNGNWPVSIEVEDA